MGALNHVAIASLAVNGTGALLLCKGIAFGSAERYGRQNPGALYPRGTNIPGDVARATDAADNQAGAALLVLGFAGQIIATIQTCWSTWPSIAAYAVAAVLITGAWFCRPWLRRRYERDLYLLRVGNEMLTWKGRAADKSRHNAQIEYRRYMSSEGRGDELNEWCRLAERRFGVNPTTWEAEPPAGPPSPRSAASGS